MPVAYAVTYIFGTIGSAHLLALLGPALLGIDLDAGVQALRREARRQEASGRSGTAWHQFELRAFRVKEGGPVVGKTALEAEVAATAQRVFVQRIRRGDKIIDATADTVIQAGDICAAGGAPRGAGRACSVPAAQEVDDRELLSVPAEGVDVYVTSKDVDGKTLAEIATRSPMARAVFSCARSHAARSRPKFRSSRTPSYNRGDIVTLVGRTKDIAQGDQDDRRRRIAQPMSRMWPSSARPSRSARCVGAFVYKVGGIPLTLSTAGGALFSGLFFGWLRSVKPTFGRIPSPTVWFMNSVGFNIFIAVVGISSGPAFVAGLQKLGFSLFRGAWWRRPCR